MLPDLDGFDGARAHERGTAAPPTPRCSSSPPVADLDDRLRGSPLGGDDYMTKPFSVEEMLLRIERHPAARPRAYEETGPRLVVGDLELDEESHEVWRGERRSSSRPPSSGSSTT